MASPDILPRNETLSFYPLESNRWPLALTFIAIILITSHYISNKQARQSLPPGPKGWPFIGHAFGLGKYAHRTLTEWSREYGPIISVRLGGQLWIVLNDREAVDELMRKRGQNYNSRNFGYISHNILTRNAMMAVVNGELWKKMRKVLNGFLAKSAVAAYADRVDYEGVLFMTQLLENGGQSDGVDPYYFCALYAMNNIMSMTFQQRFESVDDPLYRRILAHTVEFMRLLRVGGQAGDFFPKPLLRLFFRKNMEDAERWAKNTDEIFGRLCEDLRARIDHGDDINSLVAAVLRCQKEEGLSNDEVYQNAEMFVQAGTQTSTVTLAWLIAVLAYHPDVQDKAFDNIKSVVGLERLPTLDDKDALPYIDCIIKEILRFRTPNLLGIPHATDKDDIFRGHFIPAKTTIIVNQHAIHTDPTVYSEPEKFLPERHTQIANISSYELSHSSQYPRDHHAFGEGRRFCLGLHAADMTLFMAASRLLACFKIKLATDPVTGKEVEIDLDGGIPGLAERPHPYKVVFEPRHEGVSTLLGKRTEELRATGDMVLPLNGKDF